MFWKKNISEYENLTSLFTPTANKKCNLSNSFLKNEHYSSSIPGTVHCKRRPTLYSSYYVIALVKPTWENFNHWSSPEEIHVKNHLL